MKSALALRREYGRVHRLHLQNVHRFTRGKPSSERDYYMAMGAFQALAWAIGENAQRPSISAAPSPQIRKGSSASSTEPHHD